MKKLTFLLLLLVVFTSCEKTEVIEPCSGRLFIEQYNTLSGGVARYLIPYNCNLTPEENLSCPDCMQSEIGCRIVIR